MFSFEKAHFQMEAFFWRPEKEKSKNERRKTIFDFGERRSSVFEVNLYQGPKFKKITTIPSSMDRTNRRSNDFYLQTIFPKKSKQTRFKSEKGLWYSKITEN